MIKNKKSKILQLLKENIIIFSLFLLILLISNYFLSNFNITINDIIFLCKNFSIILFLFLVLFIFFIFKFSYFIKSLFRIRRNDLIFTYIFLWLFLLWYFIWFYSSVLILLYLVILFFVIYKQDYLENINNKWYLVPDKTLGENDQDQLWFSDKVKDFSNILYNNWDKNNYVFWLIAEWGAWKSSFLKKLRNEEIIKDNCIFIDFNIWYYDNEKELLEKFLENIISTFKEEWYYLSKLSKNFTEFIELLDKNSSSIFWFNFNFSNKKTLYELKKNIDDSLKNIDKKFIIVIDDLDRISSNKLKEVFRIVDLCRDFHNTNYILCYDPLSFNSIDTNLIEKTRQNEWKILSIDTEIVNTKELVKYMSKIINVYYSLEVDKVKLRNYFKNLFKNKDYINVSEKSGEWIDKWIDNLFSLENYRLWGEYYSNIRWIKRILNNLITLNKSITSDDNYIYNLFDVEWWGLEFDIFVKFILLKLYNSSLYKDIQDEFIISWISNNHFLLNNKYSLWYWTNNKKENIEYEKYLNELNIKEFKLLNNIIPKYYGNNNYSIYNDRIKLREWNNIKRYIDFIQTNNEIWYNRFILSKIDDFKNNTKLENIFTEIYNIYKIDWLDKFISEFRKQIWSWEEKNNFKQNKAFELIDFIINYDLFYKFDIKDNFTFYIDIASILNNSSPVDNTNSNNLKYIWDYFYWEWDYDKSLYNKILDKWESFSTDEWRIIWLRETLRLLFSIDERRWWNFFNFWKWMWESYKMYNSIYNEFKNRYINKNINLFKYIFKWEKSINKDSRSMISHITYMLTYYWNETSKKELSDYFIKCFTEDLNLFLKFLESYIKDSERMLRNTDKDFVIDIVSFYENFDKKDMIKFVNDNKEKLIELANNDLLLNSIYVWWDKIETNQKEVLEEFFNRLKL